MPQTSINFQFFPGALVRVPMVVAELSTANANTGVVPQRSLLIGQMLSTGNATANVPIIATSQADAVKAFGSGSMLSMMHQQYRLTDPFGTLYLLPVADLSGGTKGTVAIVVSGTATAAGTLNCYIAGVNVQVAVSASDTASVVAGNLNTAIASVVSTLPCTSAVTSATVTLTANHKGAVAGDIDVRLNYRGAIAGEVTPAGLSFAITPAAGTGDPDLATALANLPANTFDYIGFPYASSADFTEIVGLLSDATGRWSWQSELFGMAFTALRGSFSALATYGVTNNAQHISVMGYFDSPTPSYQVAADYTAACAASLRVDPALPLNTVQMNWLAPPMQSRFTISEQNSLLFDGVSTFNVAQGGVVQIQRAITTYQTNPAGAPDDSYLNCERLATLTAVIRAIRTDLQQKYSRKKLVIDGTPIPAGSNLTTAQSIAYEVVAIYQQLATSGLVQDPTTFAKTIGWQNAGNGQVNLLLPINCANQLETIAMLVQFLSS